MISLRTMEGLNLTTVVQEFGQEKATAIVAAAQQPIVNGLMIRNENRLQLTNAGKLMADGIISELFAD